MSGVTVICPNNRRVVVKFDGAVKTLFQILDEACKKQGFMPEKYGLKHHNRFVDLSMTFRMSGLPQNCTLEMVEFTPAQQYKQEKEESEDVQVALQLPDGRRLMNNVPSGATLLDMLLDFEKSSEMKLVEPESDVEDIQPVCFYLHNEFIGCVSLGATTLKQLGIRGRALFRYAPRQIDAVKLKEINDTIERSRAKMRKLEETYEKKLQDNLEHERDQQRRRDEEEALEQLRQQQIDLQTQTSTNDVSMIDSTVAQSADTRPKYPNDSEASAVSSGVTNRQARLDALQSMLAMVDRSIVEGGELPWENEPQSQRSPMDFQDFKFPEETKGMDLMVKSSANAGGYQGAPAIEPCDRRAAAFSLADVAEVTTEELPPEFFDLTVDDVQAQLRDIKEQTEERVLVPESYIRQKDFERKLQAWKMTVIRIRMPDRTVLQGVFRTLENVTALYRFVEDNLRQSGGNFELCLPPNIAITNLDRNLLQAGLAPRATLLHKLKSGNAPSESYLSSSLVENMKSPAEADRMAEQSLSENSSYVPYRPTVTGEGSQRQSGGSSGAGASKSVNPKWMPGKGKK